MITVISPGTTLIFDIPTSSRTTSGCMYDTKRITWCVCMRCPLSRVHLRFSATNESNNRTCVLSHRPQAEDFRRQRALCVIRATGYMVTSRLAVHSRREICGRDSAPVCVCVYQNKRKTRGPMLILNGSRSRSPEGGECGTNNNNDFALYLPPCCGGAVERVVG